MAIGYPYRVFRYQVVIDGINRAGFSEVSGMNLSTAVVEYREGDDLRNTPRKLPGLTTFGNVTLRWGISDDVEFLEWIHSVSPDNTAGPTGLVRKTIRNYQLERLFECISVNIWHQVLSTILMITWQVMD